MPPIPSGIGGHATFATHWCALRLLAVRRYWRLWRTASSPAAVHPWRKRPVRTAPTTKRHPANTGPPTTSAANPSRATTLPAHRPTLPQLAAHIVQTGLLLRGQHATHLLSLLETGHELFVTQGTHAIERRASFGQVAITLGGVEQIGTRPQQIGLIGPRGRRILQRFESLHLLIGQLQFGAHPQQHAGRIATSSTTHAPITRPGVGTSR